jgi:uncharacterized protein YjiS (DUF1127 family)
MIGDSLFWSSAFYRERPGPEIDRDGPAAGPIQRLAILISTWLQRGTERRRLQSHGDHRLKDTDVSRHDVERDVRDLDEHRRHIAACRLAIAWIGEGDAEY